LVWLPPISLAQARFRQTGPGATTRGGGGRPVEPKRGQRVPCCICHQRGARLSTAEEGAKFRHTGGGQRLGEGPTTYGGHRETGTCPACSFCGIQQPDFSPKFPTSWIGPETQLPPHGHPPRRRHRRNPRLHSHPSPNTGSLRWFEHPLRLRSIALFDPCWRPACGASPRGAPPGPPSEGTGLRGQGGGGDPAPLSVVQHRGLLSMNHS